MDFASYFDLVDHLRRQASRVLGAEELTGLRFSDPPSPEHGDLSLACHGLARERRRKPQELAEALAKALVEDAAVERVSALNGFCNLRLDRSVLWSTVQSALAGAGGRYGRRPPARPGSWLIEYSGPNTNKPLHIGHLRNTILGAALADIVELFGHQVTRYNIINDRGIHICKSMVAYESFGDGATPATTGEKGDQLVGRFYSLFAEKAAEEFESWCRGEGAERLDAYRREQRQRIVGAADLKLRLEFLRARDPRSLPFQPRKTSAARYPELMGKEPALERSYQEWRRGQAERAAALEEKEALALFQAAEARAFEAEVSVVHAKARETLRLWEEGEPRVRALWREMNGWVLEGLDQTYARLGVRFDHVDYESETYLLGKEMVQELLDRGIARRREDGAVVFDLPAGPAGEASLEKILLRADGTSVYMTQDLGTLLRRQDRHRPDRIIYVVGSEQELHFQALFAVVDRHTPGLGSRCVHLSYGMVELPHGKMKSREGEIVEADGFLDDVKSAATAQVRERSPDLEETELLDRAEAISLAAVKYHLLKFSKRSTVKFDVESALDMNGKTGTYCLYAIARIHSILRKVREAGLCVEIPESIDVKKLAPEEAALFLLVLRFPEAVEQAVEDLEPYHVAEYCYRVARSLSSWYTAADESGAVRFPVVSCPDEETRRIRVALVRSVGQVLETGLRSLGIRSLAAM